MLNRGASWVYKPRLSTLPFAGATLFIPLFKTEIIYSEILPNLHTFQHYDPYSMFPKDFFPSLKLGYSLDSYCRWTKWMSTESGGASDKELISALVSKFPTEACATPSKISVRRVGTKLPIKPTDSKPTFASFDTLKGFQCLQSQQSDGAPCLDYEVQLCCPGW